MAKLNRKVPGPKILPHEGAPAVRINPEQQLRRVVMVSMLWEDQFYIDGESHAQIIAETLPLVAPERVAEIAIEAREKQKLRHVPLFLVREMARRKDMPAGLVSKTLARVIQRADELTEFLAIYWKDGADQPLSAQVKKGLAAAFQKFDAYQLAKYDRDGAVKLRDVLFLVHAKPSRVVELRDHDGQPYKTAAESKVIPKNKHRGEVVRHRDGQGGVWAKLVDKTLESPDTWEVAISAAKPEEKKAAWTRLLTEGKLYALALLRNLRNMQQAGVDDAAIRDGLAKMKTERVLPFRFIAAARAVPRLEDAIEPVMLKCLDGAEKLSGYTVLLVDVSGSMNDPISAKSDLRRIDAACGLAMLLREIGERVSVVSFSNSAVEVPARRGFALRDAIDASQPHGATYTGQAILAAQGAYPKHDRMIVITDEQSHDAIPAPAAKGYVINVAAYQNGVGYGAWHHIDGWSEACIDYIRSYEAQ